MEGIIEIIGKILEVVFFTASFIIIAIIFIAFMLAMVKMAVDVIGYEFDEDE